MQAKSEMTRTMKKTMDVVLTARSIKGMYDSAEAPQQRTPEERK